MLLTVSYCHLSVVHLSQLVVLSSQSLLHSLGYYKIILLTFYVEAGMAAVMLVLGPHHYYILAFFLTANM